MKVELTLGVGDHSGPITIPEGTEVEVVQDMGDTWIVEATELDQDFWVRPSEVELDNS